ncbi:hypothetical protein QFC19_000160 [Naganishia cerealis]|uniref:Uncharacterized protein n=1 Tax=Naganishia cerealis TaxID=610337 RepID=A0ACC2WQA8_9TREE|nr:hypothetical protein QFC19_000160 [Naganishia cerealis]
MPMLSYKAGRAVRRSEESDWVDPVPEKGTLAFELVDDLAQLIWTSREPGSNTEREYVPLFTIAPALPSSSPLPVAPQRVPPFPGRRDSREGLDGQYGPDYWFQDADSTRYPEFAQTINVFLQNPDSFPGHTTVSPTPSPALARAAAVSISTDTTAPPLSTAAAAGIPSTPAPSAHASSSGVPNAPVANRVGQLMGSERGRGAAAGESTPSSGRGGATLGAGVGDHQFSREQLGALAALLQGSSVDASAAAGVGDQETQEVSFVDAHLTDILTASTITPLLQRSPSLITRLLPHLPADLPFSSPPTAEEIHELLSTPQWTEAVASFDAALRTGGLSGMIRGLGVPDRAGLGVGEFLDEVGKKAEGEDGDRMDTE